jgi:hypothetical protein
MSNWFQNAHSSRIVWIAGLIVGATAGGVAGWLLGY